MDKIEFMRYVGWFLLCLGGASGLFLLGKGIGIIETKDNDSSTATLWGLFLVAGGVGLILLLITYSS